MRRPDYIKCIARTHVGHQGESWCGARITMQFYFVSLDHAAENGLQQGRLVACPQCLEIAINALRNGLEPAEDANG